MAFPQFLLPCHYPWGKRKLCVWGGGGEGGGVWMNQKGRTSGNFRNMQSNIPTYSSLSSQVSAVGYLNCCIHRTQQQRQNQVVGSENISKEPTYHTLSRHPHLGSHCLRRTPSSWGCSACHRRPSCRRMCREGIFLEHTKQGNVYNPAIIVSESSGLYIIHIIVLKQH